MPWGVICHEYSKNKNRITTLSEATVAIRLLHFHFGNPAIPLSLDPWLSVPRLLVVWLCRQYLVLNYTFFIKSNFNAKKNFIDQLIDSIRSYS